jgi:hypothetical protein
MNQRKIIGVVAAAAMAAAAIAPANAAPKPPVHAYASNASHPWPALAVIGGAASVILNAAIVWNTQCRELSSQEAAASFFLPVVGIAFDAQTSKCKTPKA